MKRHPKYDTLMMDYDFAILVLCDELFFTEVIKEFLEGSRNFFYGAIKRGGGKGRAIKEKRTFLLNLTKVPTAIRSRGGGG